MLFTKLTSMHLNPTPDQRRVVKVQTKEKGEQQDGGDHCCPIVPNLIWTVTTNKSEDEEEPIVQSLTLANSA